MAAFLGHIYPVWLGFRGGKGVATYLGCLIGLWWPGALGFAAVWLGIAFATRFSSAAALVGSLAVPPLFFLTGQITDGVAFSLMSLILWWKHRANVQRLMQGTESRIGGQGLIVGGRDLGDAERLDWLRLIRSENVGPRTFAKLLDRYESAGAALKALPALASKATLALHHHLFGGRCRGRVEPREEAQHPLRRVLRGPPIRRRCAPSTRRLPSSPSRDRSRSCRGRSWASWGRATRPRPASSSRSAWRAALAEGRLRHRLRPRARHRRQGPIWRASTPARWRCWPEATITSIPAKHEGLARRICGQGALISEMPARLGTPAPASSRGANRIVSGLSLGVVVVEASRRSGSLITARFANEQGPRRLRRAGIAARRAGPEGTKRP